MNQSPGIDIVSSFRRRRVRRGMALALSASSLVLLLIFGTLAWILRDGMGPDAVESSGIEAWRRVLAEIWPVVAFCVFLLIVALFVWPRPSSPHATTNERGS